MVRRIIDPKGRPWDVTLSGRYTQYVRDELSLEFQLVGGTERRYVRTSPRGAKVPEMAWQQFTDADLTRLLHSSQPSWTSPDGGYRAE
jgi:hypothetical protein